MNKPDEEKKIDQSRKEPLTAKIERVPLRDVWPHEANDFTRWLEDNIDVLGDVIGRDIDNVEREKKTAESTFSVDLVASDKDGNSIIIENQLEKSNHDHLGKLITYLTAMQARVAVWIVADPRPEHVAAMSWLNESFNADFYLLKIEAIRIENSRPALLPTLIVGPSEEVKSIGRNRQKMSERDRERYQKRYEWWSQLIEHPDAKEHRHLSPSKYSWLSRGSGVRGISFIYTVSMGGSSAGIKIDLGKDMDRENLWVFDQLHAKKNQIEKIYGSGLDWDRGENKRASWIGVTLPGGYNDPEDKWKVAQDSITGAMNRFICAVRPHLKKLKPVKEVSS